MLSIIRNTDSESLIKLFELLNLLYKFNPKFFNTDFDFSQIKALKNCSLFTSMPLIVSCLFHYSQAIIKKFKELKIFKKFLNKKAYTLLVIQKCYDSQIIKI